MKDIPCPYCKKSRASQERGVWPFCSERCQTEDLGAWASETYRIPVQDASASEEDFPDSPEED